MKQDWVWNIKSEGYDGVIFKGKDIYPGNELKNDEYIVFDPNQVKSAISNVGSFGNIDQYGRIDPRISYDEGPPDLPIPEGLQPGRSDAVSRAFEGVTDYEGALAVANAGGHLKADKSGKLIGSPDLTEAELGPWRARLDKLIADAKMKGLGWYEDVRNVINEVSETPEQASLLARGGAAYSPQASPTQETNYFFRHHNERVLTGQEPVITTAQRASAVNKGYGDVGANSGFIELTPENINLGKKTGPYGVSKDPTVPRGWEAASDLWHGRALEYAPDEGQAAFDRAFSDTEHAFIKGENVLALERAKAAGTLPPDANVEQPAGGGLGPEALRRSTWTSRTPATPPASARRRGRRPTKRRCATRWRGSAAASSAAPRWSAASIRPAAGWVSSGHLGGQPDLNQAFSTEMEAAGGNPKSSVISALQMYQRPKVERAGLLERPGRGHAA